MNDKQLKGFITVVKKGSFSKAAKELYISPQALVQQTDQLEREIGTKLVERSPRGVICTPAGKFFYDNICHLNSYMTQVIAECRNLGIDRTNILKIGVFSTPLFMPSMCFSFSQKYPQIEIQQVEMNTDHDFDLLLNGEVDVMESAPFSVFDGKGLVFTKLTDVQPVCVFSKEHPLAVKARIEPEDLAGQTVAVPDINFFFKDGKASEAMKEANFIDKIFGREKMLRICLDGGIYIMPEPGGLALRPLVSVPFHFDMLEIGLRSRPELSPNEKLFIAETVKRFATV